MILWWAYGFGTYTGSFVSKSPVLLQNLTARW